MKPTTAIMFLACLSTACVEINGGAVEISWVIRSNAGSAITDCSCADPEIAKVRLLLQGVDAAGNPIAGATPCAGQAQCDFPCASQTGSTAFNIPETHGGDRYRVSLEAVGTDGAPLTLQVMAPAPILREVVRGQPTEIDAIQLVADCAMECQMMNSSGVCARP